MKHSLIKTLAFVFTCGFASSAMATDYNFRATNNGVCGAFVVGEYSCGNPPTAGFVCVIKHKSSTLATRLIHTSAPNPLTCEANRMTAVNHARSSCIAYFNASPLTRPGGACSLDMNNAANISTTLCPDSGC